MQIRSFATRTALLSLVLSCVAAISLTSAATARSKPAAKSGAHVSASSCKQARAAARRARASSLRLCGVSLRNTSRTRDVTAPTVSWQSPGNGATVKGVLEGAGCLASASDNRGIGKVTFKLDGSTLGKDSQAPFTCRFDTTKVADGTHTLVVIATDSSGNSSSAAIGVSVANKPAPVTTPPPPPAESSTSEPTGPTPPTTTESPGSTESPSSTEPPATTEPPAPADLTAPAVVWQTPAAAATVSGTLQGSSCEAGASDDRGVEKVVFKVDGTTLNTDTGAPWTCVFDSTKVTDGSHTLTATAYDAAGNAGSATRTVTVANTVITAPAPNPAPSPAGMIVGLDAGNYGSAGATDVRNAVNTVRYDTERGVSTLENFKKAGLRIQMLFPGPYNSGGVCALNATNWVAETLSFYKANTNPTQTPIVEALNEPAGTWFWGSNAASATNATCYRNLLKKTHEAFHNQYGSSAPKILGTLDGSGGLAFGKAWYTSDWSTYVDGFIVHPYGGTGSRATSALGNRSLIESARALTGGPIYITEVGWPTATGQPATGDSLQWSEAEQANNITNFLAWCNGTGYVNEVIYFNYRDFGTNSWYGIERADGTRKPAYSALHQAAEKYGI